MHEAHDFANELTTGQQLEVVVVGVPNQYEALSLLTCRLIQSAALLMGDDAVPGLTPFWWTFLMSRAEPVENVHDDSASETLLYTRVQGADG